MLKILIVEDYPATSELISSVLRIEGFQTVIASDGTSGLKLAREENPDLILLDVMLPEMSGYDVCRQLKSDPKTSSIPIIIVSVRAANENVQKGKELGADDFLAKPFEPARLVSFVKRHLADKLKKMEGKNGT